MKVPLKSSAWAVQAKPTAVPPKMAAAAKPAVTFMAALPLLAAKPHGAYANRWPMRPVHHYLPARSISQRPVFDQGITTSNYMVDFRFPLDYPDQQALTDYLSNERDEFLDLAAEQPMQRRTRPYELGIVEDSYRSDTPASGTESMLFTVYYDTGNHPATAYDAFNYDLSKRAPITLDTLLSPALNRWTLWTRSPSSR
jgi:hypothetical protein